MNNELRLQLDKVKELIKNHPDVKEYNALAIQVNNSTFIKEKEDLSLLDIKLYTGRTHQIRAQLAFNKIFVLGDGKYSTNEINKKFDFKTQALCAVEYKFKLENTSFLSYLNNKTIKIY